MSRPEKYYPFALVLYHWVDGFNPHIVADSVVNVTESGPYFGNHSDGIEQEKAYLCHDEHYYKEIDKDDRKTWEKVVRK